MQGLDFRKKRGKKVKKPGAGEKEEHARRAPV